MLCQSGSWGFCKPLPLPSGDAGCEEMRSNPLLQVPKLRPRVKWLVCGYWATSEQRLHSLPLGHSASRPASSVHTGTRQPPRWVTPLVRSFQDFFQSTGAELEKPSEPLRLSFDIPLLQLTEVGAGGVQRGVFLSGCWSSLWKEAQI